MNDLPLIFFSFQLAIKQRYRFCHRQFSQVAQIHEELLQLTKTSPESSMVQKLAVDSPRLGADVGQPSLWHEYAFCCENLVFQMRRTIDSFIQWVALICDPTKNKIGLTLGQSGLDDLLKPGGNTKLVFQQLLGSDSLNNGDPTGFRECPIFCV